MSRAPPLAPARWRGTSSSFSYGVPLGSRYQRRRVASSQLGGALPAAHRLGMNSTPGRFYSPELDGLRFVAAFLVFVHHAPQLPYLGAIKEHGWLGVDLFLALSAYLITRLAMLERERTGDFALRLFFIRRALRIWPLYFLFALAACLVSFLAGVTDAATSARWALAHLSFSANLLTAVQGYSAVSFSPHLWTISLEEQAYLLLALLLSVAFAKNASPRAAVKDGLPSSPS